MAAGEVSSTVEVERKYDVGPGARVPAVDGFTSATLTKPESLHAVYYDTPNGILAANSITLRLRTGGHDDGWHLKMPSNGERVEHHADASAEPPAALLSLVSPLIEAAPVAIAVIDTHRRTTYLLQPDGTAVAEVADDHVCATDLQTGTERSWREWEVEATSSGLTVQPEVSTLLTHIEHALIDSGAVPSAHRSKLARAMGRNSLG